METRSAYTEISRGWFDIGYSTFHVSDSRGGTRERLSLDENRVEGMMAVVVGRRGDGGSIKCKPRTNGATLLISHLPRGVTQSQGVE